MLYSAITPMPLKSNLPVVLASASPRRIELLKEVFEEFDVIPADLDEQALTVEDPFETAQGLAKAKAEKIAALRPEALVIGADTVVALDGVQFGKPTGRNEAIRMICLLSGKTHSVITGVCVIRHGKAVCFAGESRVTFRELSLPEIEAYAATGEPMDKAGAYAIQGGAKSFVARLDGSITNVVGLPLERLLQTLSNWAIPVNRERTRD